MSKPWTYLVLGAASLLPAAVHAQDAPPAADADAATAAVPAEAAPADDSADTGPRHSASRMIEEVVVTAQKREENIQNVPIAIQAFSADKLEALGIQSAQDLEKVTPGLTITNAAGFNVAYLRGVGTDAFLPGADPSVPFYIDGVPLLGAQGSSDTLGRIQRVEVLKGPQGTLFGRNATGGAINIITPDPTNVFEGDATVGFANFTAFSSLGYINAPITNDIAASLSAYDNHQGNFYVNDTGPIEAVFSRGGRLKLRWQATDDLNIILSGSYNESANNGGLTFENTRVAPDFSLVLPQDPKADRHVSFDSLSGAATHSYLASATIVYKTSWLDTKFIYSNQRLSAPFVQSDFDKSDLPIVNINSIHQISRQTTAELQFLSNEQTPLGDVFKWVGGLFYLRTSGGFNPIQFRVARDPLTALINDSNGSPAAIAEATALTAILDTLIAPTGQNLASSGAAILSNGVLESQAYSAYFQGTYNITEKLEFTAGLRYQHEERDLVDSETGIPTADGGEQALLTENVPTLHSNQFSPRVALKYQFNPHSQVYTSWARAFKSPTYNTVNVAGGVPTTVGCLTGFIEMTSTTGSPICAPDIKPVKAERVDSFELGTKSDFFDRNLRLNAATFYTRQHNLLTGFVALASGGVVQYENAPAARIYGAEFDATLTPLPQLDPGLVLTSAATFLNAKYTDYPDGKGFDTTTGLAFGAGGTEPLPPRNFAGNDIVRTPRMTINFGISQTIPLERSSLELASDVTYTSKFYFLPQDDDLYSRQANTILNTHATYIFDPWSMQFTAYINNLTNKDYNEVVFVDDFGRNQVLNAPRTYGLRAKWTFGS